MPIMYIYRINKNKNVYDVSKYSNKNVKIIIKQFCFNYFIDV